MSRGGSWLGACGEGSAVKASWGGDLLPSGKTTRGGEGGG